MPRARAPRSRARPARATRPRAATILVAADWAPIRAFDPIVRHDPASIYGDLLTRLRAADLRIVNCECALTRANRSIWKSGAVFKGEPAHAQGLAAVPFDVACLGNNHVLDYDVTGLRETLRVLHRQGIRTVGAGLVAGEAYAPLALTVNGVRVHVINFCEGEDLTASTGGGPGVFGWDIPRVEALVRRDKAQGALVIAIGHCGLEYVPYPPPYVVAAFRAIAEAGADCVIGHHPHVPQGMEWHEGCPIFYSLGNFVFYQATDLHWRKTGFFVTLQARGSRLQGVELHPYRITDTGLRGLDAAGEREFRRTMDRLSKPFKTRDGHRRAWDAYPLAMQQPRGVPLPAPGFRGRDRLLRRLVYSRRGAPEYPTPDSGGCAARSGCAACSPAPHGRRPRDASRLRRLACGRARPGRRGCGASRWRRRDPSK
jgi:poly-gamma-glutamate capsule biosynthesis protein CapA/YwtB (metallophosphatase superfamily)